MSTYRLSQKTDRKRSHMIAVSDNWGYQREYPLPPYLLKSSVLIHCVDTSHYKGIGYSLIYYIFQWLHTRLILCCVSLRSRTWCRHQMETFSALLTLCAGNSHRALMFSLICALTNGWANDRDTGDLRRHCAHYNVTVSDTLFLYRLKSYSLELLLCPCHSFMNRMGFRRTNHIPQNKAITRTNNTDVIMGSIASQMTSLTIVCSTVYSDADQRKHQKLRVIGLCAGNSPETGEFPAQMASNAENVSIWWRHHVCCMGYIVFLHRVCLHCRQSEQRLGIPCSNVNVNPIYPTVGIQSNHASYVLNATTVLLCWEESQIYQTIVIDKGCVFYAKGLICWQRLAKPTSRLGHA